MEREFPYEHLRGATDTEAERFRLRSGRALVPGLRRLLDPGPSQENPADLGGSPRELPVRAGDIDREIIVVDNHSDDGSVETLRSDFPDVTLIANDENLGFSKANNQGIKISKGRYLLLLNNDTKVLPGAIDTLIEVMERSPHTGLLGCRLLNADGTPQLSFGNMVGFINELGRKYILNRLLGNYSNPLAKKLVDHLHSEEKEADWIRGACMFCRREAMSDVGLMDENFFMYLEEVDLGVRIKRKGWKVVYTPHAAIIHYGGVSTGKNDRAAMEYRKSQLYFYKKHYGNWGLMGLKCYLRLTKKYR